MKSSYEFKYEFSTYFVENSKTMSVLRLIMIISLFDNSKHLIISALLQIYDNYYNL